MVTYFKLSTEAANSYRRSANMPTQSEREWLEEFKIELREDIRAIIKVEVKEAIKEVVGDVLKEAIRPLEKKHDIVMAMVEGMREEKIAQDDRIMKLECRTMSTNIIISGMPENDSETVTNLKQNLHHLFEQDLQMHDKVEILNCHMLRYLPKTMDGKDRPRNVIVVLSSSADVGMVLRHARNLKGRSPPIYINQQYPAEVVSRRRILQPVYANARGLQTRASLRLDKLMIE